MAETVSAKAIRAVIGAAQVLGLDGPALAQARGLGAALTDVDARFPHRDWVGVWEDIIEKKGGDGEGLGIVAAERLPFGHWDVVDYLLATADTVGNGLRRFERYFPIISTGVTHTLEPWEDGQVAVVRRYAPDCQTRLLAPAEFAFANVISRMGTVLGSRWIPQEVVFASAPPPTDAVHRRFFGCPVRFNAAHSAIVIDAADADRALPRPDPELSRILERHGDQLISQVKTSEDFVSQVRKVIVAGLPDGEVSVARTARLLGLSVRTLQRRLAEHSVSFDDVFDSTRKELARRYLGDPRLSIQETAHLLAFGDLRGFYRAFKRWEGRTPADFRKNLAPAVGA